MNRELPVSASLRRELSKLTDDLTGTERILVRNKMAKIVVIDGKPFYIDMKMVEATHANDS